MSLLWVPAKFQVRLSTKGKIWAVMAPGHVGKTKAFFGIPCLGDGIYTVETSSRQREFPSECFWILDENQVFQLAQLQRKL